MVESRMTKKKKKRQDGDDDDDNRTMKTGGDGQHLTSLFQVYLSIYLSIVSRTKST
jgi:hypothetical protein